MEPIKLSLEQQFAIAAFKFQVAQMSREQAQAFSIEIYTHMIAREAMYRKMLKQQWNIEASPIGGTNE